MMLKHGACVLMSSRDVIVMMLIAMNDVLKREQSARFLSSHSTNGLKSF